MIDRRNDTYAPGKHLQAGEIVQEKVPRLDAFGLPAVLGLQSLLGEIPRLGPGIILR